MVFVEFTSDYPAPDTKHYFVGADLQSVLDDTKGGTEFGFAKFSSHRKVTEEEVRNLGLEYTDKGIQAVQGGCKSYSLGMAQELQSNVKITLDIAKAIDGVFL